MVYIIRNASNERVGTLAAERDEIRSLLDTADGAVLLRKAGDEKSLLFSTPEQKESVSESYSGSSGGQADTVILSPVNEPVLNDQAAAELRAYFGLSEKTNIVSYVTGKLTKSGTPRKKTSE